MGCLSQVPSSVSVCAYGEREGECVRKGSVGALVMKVRVCVCEAVSEYVWTYYCLHES